MSELAGKKVCVWLGPDAKPVRHCLVDQHERTMPEPGMPVFIVSFDDSGAMGSGDIYYADHGGAMVCVMPTWAFAYVNGKHENIYIVDEPRPETMLICASS